ncbi:MAG: hypothetical protein KDJ17_01315 [Hyphomicrobiaceae bacterium]|nr:hypothetical protein [Hyphomicrobiaceae bacterium]
MALKRIRIELARDHDFPEGSRDRGYDFIAPLDDSGHLVAEEWKASRDRCRVRRFWPGEKDEMGRLIRRPGGSWAFDYDPSQKEDDEAGFKLDKHRFVPGEYVSFTEHDGKLRTFRVMSVLDFE